MKLGISLCSDPATNAEEARLLECAGVDALWFADVPLLGWGDPYVAMSLAAAATTRLSVGTYITPLGLRAAPMVATAFATLNRLAPKRVVLGCGSGSVTRMLIGKPPLRMKELRQELKTIRSLLDDGQATAGDVQIRFYDWRRPSLNLEDHIRIHVAASGPRTATLAGELGDGLITVGEHDPQALRRLLDAAHGRAARANRPVDDFEFVLGVGALCLVRPNEPIDSPRIRAIVQPLITEMFAFFSIMDLPVEQVAAGAQKSFLRFKAWAAKRHGSDRANQLRGLFDRHVARDPDQDQFVDAETIRALTLTGDLDDLSKRLRAIAMVGGVTHVIVTRHFDRPWTDADEIDELVELIRRVG